MDFFKTKTLLSKAFRQSNNEVCPVAALRNLFYFYTCLPEKPFFTDRNIVTNVLVEANIVLCDAKQIIAFDHKLIIILL